MDCKVDSTPYSPFNNHLNNFFLKRSFIFWSVFTWVCTLSIATCAWPLPWPLWPVKFVWFGAGDGVGSFKPKGIGETRLAGWCCGNGVEEVMGQQECRNCHYHRVLVRPCGTLCINHSMSHYSMCTIQRGSPTTGPQPHISCVWVSQIRSYMIACFMFVMQWVEANIPFGPIQNSSQKFKMF